MVLRFKQLDINPCYYVCNKGFILKSKVLKKTKEVKFSIMCQRRNKQGYIQVFLTNLFGERKTYKVHRLVGEYFIPKIEGKDWINHMDGNKTNNHVDNLEWCSPTENSLHAYKKGLNHSKKCPVLCTTNGKIYSSQSEASKDLNISRKAILMILEGKRTSLKGLSFKYVDENWKNN